jgi:hypothetical protein
MGKEVRRRYKDGKNIVRLSLAKVAKVNYKYNTVDVITIQDKNDTTKNANDNGRYSARLPVQFGGQTPDGKVFGTNTLVTVGCLVLVGFLEGHKDNPIILNIYGEADNQSMLTRTTFTGANESDEEVQAELWQLFTLYPSMTYQNIDGHGNQEVTFPGKTFFYASADDDRVNDAFFDYDHLPSSSYANGDLIEPTVPDAPNMLYVHQSVVGDHRVTFFIKSDGTVRMGSRHADGGGVTFWQMNTDGSFKIQQSNDTVDPEDESSNFSSFSINEHGDIILQAGNSVLSIGKEGLLLNGGAISGGSGGSIDLTGNQVIVDMQGDITTLQKATTADGIVQVVTESTPWQNISNTVANQLENTKQTFTSQPIPPYNVGDIWMTTNGSYVCISPEPIGAIFNTNDWRLSADITSQGTASDTSSVNGTPSSTWTSTITSASSTASAAQTTADSKAEMFLSQPVPPYKKGDLWNNNGTMYVSNITRPNGATFLMADWVLAADVTANNTSNDTTHVNGTPAATVTSGITSAQSAASGAQNTADGKARTFTSTPVPPYSIGDMWNMNSKVYSCTFPRAAGTSMNAMDWVLVADLTSLNTANDTANVNGTPSSTVIGNISSASSAASAAQSTANMVASMSQDPGFQQGLAYLTKDDATNAVGSAITDTNITVVGNSGVTGGNVIQVKNTYWLYSKYAYPVDTTHTYKVRFRVKQTADSQTANTSKVYAGVATYDNTGTLQTTSPGTHRWCATSGTQIAVADGWHYFEGTITGEGNLNHNQFRTGTAYARPVFIVNYSGGTGTAIVDLLDFDDITQQVNAQGYADTGITNLVIGGRNYIKNTADFQQSADGLSITNWNLLTGSSISATMALTDDDTFGTVLDVNVATNATSNNTLSIQNDALTLPGGKFVVGATYTVSFFMKSACSMTVGFMDADGTNLVAPVSTVIPPLADWERIVYSFKATAQGNAPVLYLALADTTHTGDILITEVQLEDGPKATGYHPAPEDVNDNISTIQSSVDNVLQGTFPTDMGTAIISVVTGSDTYISSLNDKADASDLSGYATSTQLAEGIAGANGYTDGKIEGIDFSPYVTTSSLSQTKTDITAQFTASGGVNMLKNSIGHSFLDDGTPAFWTVTAGTPAQSLDPTIEHYGASSGFTMNGATMNQVVTVTPGIPYTISAVVLKDTAGTGYIKVSDTSTPAVSQTINLVSGTDYTYEKLSVSITPATSTVTVEISGDTASGGVLFTCVMLNIGTQAFTWQQAVGEVYNTNVNFDLNGIRVMSTDKDGKMTSETVMTPEKFAGYTDLNGDGRIDVSDGSEDEIFRMNGDSFVMKNAVIGPVKIVQTTGTHTGIAFVFNG